MSGQGTTFVPAGPSGPATGTSAYQGLVPTHVNPKFESFPVPLEVDNVVQRGYMRLLTEVF